VNLQECRLPSLDGWGIISAQLEVLDVSLTAFCDTALSVVCQRCRDLRVLRAHHCDRITDDGVWALAAHAHGLLELDVSYCSHITADGLRDIAKCPNLEVLRAPGTSVEEDFCLGLHGLTTLHLKGLSCLGDSTITGSIATGGPLRYLNLAECGIADPSVHHLRDHTPHLTYLNLSWCEDVSDAALQALCGELRELAVLKLRCMQVSDATVGMVARTCGRCIRSLDVGRGCLSDDGLFDIAKGCAGLTSLSVNWCEGVSDVGIAAMLQSCRAIERLDCQGCKRLTDKVSVYVPTLASPSLAWLDLSWVNSVSNNVVTTVLTEHPNSELVVVDYYGNEYNRGTVPRDGDKSDMHQAISDAMDGGLGFG
jgi:hypothetical protein